MLDIVLIIVAVLVALFALTFILYFFNLDMKLINKVYRLMQKHYDNMNKTIDTIFGNNKRRKK
jgi:hypothetical protein